MTVTSVFFCDTQTSISETTNLKMTAFWDTALSSGRRPGDEDSKQLGDVGQLLLVYSTVPQKAVIFIFAAVGTWNPSHLCLLDDSKK
jgi:hypothetical protein